MTDQFQLDNSDLKQLIKFYQHAPKLFKKVSAEVLSSMSRKGYSESRKIIIQELIIRNMALLKRGLKFINAKQSDSITRQESFFGSIDIPRHDDWEHVQTGATTRATRFMTAARVGGTEQGRAIKAAKIGEAQLHESDFRLKGSGDIKTVRFMQQIAQDKSRRWKTFMLPRGYKGMPRGIYKFNRKKGKVGRFRGKSNTIVGGGPQLLSLPLSRFRPKPIHWLDKATKRATDESFVKRIWVENATKLFEKEIVRLKLK